MDFRGYLRNAYFRLIGKTLAHPQGRAAAAAGLRGLLHWKPRLSDQPIERLEDYYPELLPQEVSGTGRDPIFITSRFRSGSTLLWNVFRQVGCTSYYEPLNERRWFDRSTRGEHVDSSHRKVTDYWREYDSVTGLGDLYCEEWTTQNFFMDEAHWAPQLKSYIRQLVIQAQERPVLQFNRIDFRLPWIRRAFPEATIVHLFRHPRDQWLSTFLRRPPFPPNGRMADFAWHDEFYLLRWCRDLKYHFPFLDESTVDHPYQLFYFVYKLSFLFGQQHADHAVCFEHLVRNPEHQLGQLFDDLRIDDQLVEQGCSVFGEPKLGRWTDYADDSWFRRHEEQCEAVLSDFIKPAPNPVSARDMEVIPGS